MAITRIGPNQSINLASNITGTLPTGNGGTGATSFAPGKVLQIVSASQTNTVTSTDTSYADITGLSVTLTPSSSSNKLYIMYNLQVSNSALAANDSLRIMRDSTGIISPSNYWRLQNNTFMAQLSGNFLDSPSTTSATTVKIQWRAESGTISLNRRGDNSTVRSVSTISVMEILA
jgi:hypothetical protein|tara:strand:+ start:620 stop:1144 length:525 start_codon:yes stop_codon:yes gene_type:complete